MPVCLFCTPHTLRNATSYASGQFVAPGRLSHTHPIACSPTIPIPIHFYVSFVVQLFSLFIYTCRPLFSFHPFSPCSLPFIHHYPTFLHPQSLSWSRVVVVVVPIHPTPPHQSIVHATPPHFTSTTTTVTTPSHPSHLIHFNV